MSSINTNLGPINPNTLATDAVGESADAPAVNSVADAAPVDRLDAPTPSARSAATETATPRLASTASPKTPQELSRGIQESLAVATEAKDSKNWTTAGLNLLSVHDQLTQLKDARAYGAFSTETLENMHTKLGEIAKDAREAGEWSVVDIVLSILTLSIYYFVKRGGKQSASEAAKQADALQNQVARFDPLNPVLNPEEKVRQTGVVSRASAMAKVNHSETDFNTLMDTITGGDSHLGVRFAAITALMTRVSDKSRTQEFKTFVSNHTETELQAMRATLQSIAERAPNSELSVNIREMLVALDTRTSPSPAFYGVSQTLKNADRKTEEARENWQLSGATIQPYELDNMKPSFEQLALALDSLFVGFEASDQPLSGSDLNTLDKEWKRLSALAVKVLEQANNHAVGSYTDDESVSNYKQALILPLQGSASALTEARNGTQMGIDFGSRVNEPTYSESDRRIALNYLLQPRRLAALNGEHFTTNFKGLTPDVYLSGMRETMMTRKAAADAARDGTLSAAMATELSRMANPKLGFGASATTKSNIARSLSATERQALASAVSKSPLLTSSEQIAILESIGAIDIRSSLVMLDQELFKAQAEELKAAEEKLSSADQETLKDARTILAAIGGSKARDLAWTNKVEGLTGEIVELTTAPRRELNGLSVTEWARQLTLRRNVGESSKTFEHHLEAALDDLKSPQAIDYLVGLNQDGSTPELQQLAIESALNPLRALASETQLNEVRAYLVSELFERTLEGNADSDSVVAAQFATFDRETQQEIFGAQLLTDLRKSSPDLVDLTVDGLETLNDVIDTLMENDPEEIRTDTQVRAAKFRDILVQLGAGEYARKKLFESYGVPQSTIDEIERSHAIKGELDKLSKAWTTYNTQLDDMNTAITEASRRVAAANAGGQLNFRQAYRDVIREKALKIDEDLTTFNTVRKGTVGALKTAVAVAALTGDGTPIDKASGVVSGVSGLGEVLLKSKSGQKFISKVASPAKLSRALDFLGPVGDGLQLASGISSAIRNFNAGNWQEGTVQVVGAVGSLAGLVGGIAMLAGATGPLAPLVVLGGTVVGIGASIASLFTGNEELTTLQEYLDGTDTDGRGPMGPTESTVVESTRISVKDFEGNERQDYRATMDALRSMLEANRGLEDLAESDNPISKKLAELNARFGRGLNASEQPEVFKLRQELIELVHEERNWKRLHAALGQNVSGFATLVAGDVREVPPKVPATTGDANVAVA